MGSGEKRGGYILATESSNHSTRVKGPVADLKEIMVGLSGEVKELHMGSWEIQRETCWKKRKELNESQKTELQKKKDFYVFF